MPKKWEWERLFELAAAEAAILILRICYGGWDGG
jgi:hypothetical protein